MSLLKKLIWDLKTAGKVDTPNPYRLADDHDDLTWDRRRDGAFADHATADDVIETKVYEAKD